jgi:tRNA (cytidine32/uridine32-2'-O)-methyltransferase
VKILKHLESIRVVLVEPSHPGNIGAVARSMKTMGLNNLVLVRPKKFPHCEASRRAAGADSVLQAATVVGDLSTAIEDCTLVLGTSVRDREVAWPTVDPRQAAEKILAHLECLGDGQSVTASPDQVQAAVLFGRENSGLSNEELDRCQAQIRISANSEYSSLNLASAVQIISYELRMRALQIDASNVLPMTVNEAAENRQQSPFELRQAGASLAQREGHLAQLQKTLIDLEFVKTNPPTMLMRKLTRLYNKAELTVEEIQILRGILSAVQTLMAKNSK